MKRKLSFIPLIGILLLFLVYGCRTEESTIEKANNLAQAKALFEKESYQFQILKYTKEIDWDHPIYSKGEEYETVEVTLSLKDGINIKESEEAKHRLLFRKTKKDNSWKTYYLFIAPETGTENVNSLEKVSFQSIPKDFHGDIIVFDQNNKITDQLAFPSSNKIQKLASTKLDLQSKLPEVLMTCRYLGWWYDGGYFEPILNLGCIDVISGPTSDYGPHGGGGGGGGTGTGSPSSSPNQEIINKLGKFPCAQKLLEQLPNLNNSLASLVKNIFGENNKNIQVTFEPKEFKGSEEIVEGKTDLVRQDGLNMTINIFLNQDMLKTATQEYVLSIMYHEFIHAYLHYERINLSSQDFAQKYPNLESYDIPLADGTTVTKYRFYDDHGAFGPFINTIADAILSYNPKFPRDQALFLAMGGVTKEMPKGGFGTNQNERNPKKYGNSVGTRCAQ